MTTPVLWCEWYTGPYQIVLVIIRYLFVSIFSNTVVSNVHHITIIILIVTDSQTSGSLELASVTVNHGHECSGGQVKYLENAKFIKCSKTDICLNYTEMWLWTNCNSMIRNWLWQEVFWLMQSNDFVENLQLATTWWWVIQNKNR